MTVIPALAPMAAVRLVEIPGHLPKAARFVLHLLQKMEAGSLHLTMPDGQIYAFGTQEPPHAHIFIRDIECFSAILTGGDIGFAQSYMEGKWDTPDLLKVLQVLVANRAALEKLVYGNIWAGLFYRIRHWLNRNSRAGSMRNIHAHYDIGNSFYQLWLDEGMTYSSALFTNEDDPLLLAQERKYARILKEISLSCAGHILEIGCGWGGFAEAALSAGHDVTGLTLSREQLAVAKARCAGLADVPGQWDLRLQDYRDCHGQFDAIVSIEMFEAVGEEFWPDYFAALKRNLKPGGRAVIQTITIAEDLFDRYRKSSDFIQQYIFPGGMLPSISAFCDEARLAGLELVESFAFGQDYARTLEMWRDRFQKAGAQVKAQGFDERFLRTWDFYLCYCAAAFRYANTNVVQFTLQAPLEV